MAVAVCAIAALLLSFLQAAADDYHDHGYLYLSPQPGASYTPQATRFVLVRFKDFSPTQVTNLASFISVGGANSGAHSGQTHIASDGRTVIFEMTNSFASNELVTVSLNPQVESLDGLIEPYQYQFMVAGPFPGSFPIQLAILAAMTNGATSATTPVKSAADEDPSPLAFASPGRAGIMPNGVSVPSDFPFLKILTNDNPDGDYIFINQFATPYYNVIFDNSGSPVWYQKMNEDRRDMKVQRNGVLTMQARAGGVRYIGLDNHYRQIATYKAVNGYDTDEHELVVLEDGTYLMVVIQRCVVDMRKYVPGGLPTAAVYESAVQQFTPSGELIFQWRSWDNFDIRDVRLDSLTSGTIHFAHLNAIELDTDGNMLVSSRMVSEVTKVNLDSGEIIWRLGGAHSDFTFPNDPLNGFRNQHAIRPLGTNRYLLFDNGNLHSPPVSRAVEYALNPISHTAALVWQFPPTPTNRIYSTFMGNVQRLNNGNTLINWAVGNLPKLTEVRPDGSKAFEVDWAKANQTYRTWRCPWQGVALKPNLIIESYPDYVLLLFNKFGDTNVDHYRIYGGTSPTPTNVISTSPVSLAKLTDLQNQQRYYFRVTAVSRDGTESDFSDETNVFVNILQPGQNMVNNGDFFNGGNSWQFALTGTASAQFNTSNGDAFIPIFNPGTQVTDIQLRQTGKKLIQGRKYVLEFDASADLPRFIQVQLWRDNIIYQTFNVALNPLLQHFTFPFTVTAATDLNVFLSFNLGASPGAVHLDDISLIMLTPGDMNHDDCVNLEDVKLWSERWLQTGGDSDADLDLSGRVDFGDLGILGQNWSKGNCQ